MMAASDVSSEWLKINHHDTHDFQLRTQANGRRGVRSDSPLAIVRGSNCAPTCDGSEFHARRNVMKLRFANSNAPAAFWASPNNSIYELILRSGDWTATRRAAAMAPGFPREDPVKDPPVRPGRPMPPDVPAPNPHDVPVKEPIDEPTPHGKPKPTKPLPQKPDT